MSLKLFIGGCPRSGTTIMRDLLHAHSRIHVGDERYGLKFVTGLPEDAFKLKRFFSVKVGDAACGAPPPDRSMKARRKFAKAALVGDKIPKIYEHLEATARQFPDARFIFLLRNLYDVACSYEARAADPGDLNWSRDFGHSVAVQEWNDCLYALKTAPALPIAVVPYEDFFLDGRGLEALFDFLGLNLEAQVVEAHRDTVAKCLHVNETRKRQLDARKTQQLLLNGHFWDYEQVMSQPSCLTGAAWRAGAGAATTDVLEQHEAAFQNAPAPVSATPQPPLIPAFAG